MEKGRGGRVVGGATAEAFSAIHQTHTLGETQLANNSTLVQQLLITIGEPVTTENDLIR